eukprot:m.139467 g.139467  ORF g.139467 m.139467 type:complete len:191 (-) comp14014_c0_seq30:2926-3498(-)
MFSILTSFVWLRMLSEQYMSTMEFGSSCYTKQEGFVCFVAVNTPAHTFTRTHLQPLVCVQEPFFQNANPDLVTLVSVTFEPVFFPSGCPVSHIGDRGDQLFLVHQGLVEEQSAQGVTINSFESGDIVGFIEMVRDAQKQTRFVAVADSHLLVIDRLKFIHLLERFPESLAAFQEQVRHSRRQQGDREAVV